MHVTVVCAGRRVQDAVVEVIIAIMLLAFCNVFRNTKQFVSIHDASELYYGGTRFGSRQGNQIFWYLSFSLSLQTNVRLAASATPRPLPYISFPLYFLKLLYHSTL
jgi:hypothetical protein